MDKLKINLENCYGIQRLQYEFDFSTSKKKAYAIYAPNGLMKTSFSKTFEALSKNEIPKEERYNRPSTYSIQLDNSLISKEVIYVLKSEIDISSDTPAITDILVNPDNKKRYDELLIDIEKQKNKLINSLQKLLNIKKLEVEKTILSDWNESNFSVCIDKIQKLTINDDLSFCDYGIIFDQKAIEILKSPEFLSKSKEFTDKYEELFTLAGTIYQKGIFNPIKAEVSFLTLDKQGFFASGHKVHFKGEGESIDKASIDKKIQEINSKIDNNEELKKIKVNLAKNAQTQALIDLIENLSISQVEFLLENLKPENQTQFRKNIWIYNIQNNKDALAYINVYNENKDEINKIEAIAAQAVPRWTKAVELFNNRFVDMPFTLSITNQSQTVLGKENAKLKFIFKDNTDTVEWTRSEIKTLSQGEKRALYLLNFIFEVESRKINNKETLFIIDDVADSFDYKNKHAIVQYLEDLTKINCFYQIILTHNFDFFRTLSNNFVHRDRCLMSNRNSSEIILTKAEGIKNYFIGKWKNNILSNDIILCATIPFTRNLIEYTKGENDLDYLKLTSLLHWKNDTNQITVGNYLDIYNRLFGTNYNILNTQIMKDLLFIKADEISASISYDGLNLEDKVLLSIAIRMKAEIFLIKELRMLKNNPNYWCQSASQFGDLIKEYSSLASSSPSLITLEKISITVSSNIHLNSFMYEPILDLTIGHLVNLYKEVCNLNI
ncbi:hypothetical protein O8C80_02890 [Aliarcobacter butzleri]|uniref:hypothetical protein n=1 Tax=Aliarcobacter butzleri TaxID=28197 RepID=UPI00263D7BC1|nr:hypothetical protein [Aliarcobacter butzleri]MDN5042275.1 hypothetical protein [Aliarcobacter butzleri]